MFGAKPERPSESLPPYEALAGIPAPHIESFSYFTDVGLRLMTEELRPEYVWVEALSSWMELRLTDVTIASPTKNDDDNFYPHEARLGFMTYAGSMTGKLSYKCGDHRGDLKINMGAFPIMLRSSKCHLKGLAPRDLVRHKEEPYELGGYFIVNGNERLVRLLIGAKGNVPLCVDKAKFSSRDKNFSQYGVSIRCVRPDATTETNVIHYLNDGTCKLRIKMFKRELFIPVVLVLKALMETTDFEIYTKVCQGDLENTFVTDRIELMLRETKALECESTEQCLVYLGANFAYPMRISKYYDFKKVGQILLEDYIFVHLKSNTEKFNLLIHMLRKLLFLVKGDLVEDSPDRMNNQDIVTSGAIVSMIVRDYLSEFMRSIRNLLLRNYGKDPSHTPKAILAAVEKTPPLSERINYFMATGNLKSEHGIDLMQVSGFSVVAEKINHLRFLSHFRGVHRGQFFTTMKTTTIRKLQPEVWGFMCPVHTPDGAPCGLLNHMTAQARVISEAFDTSEVVPYLVSLGMSPMNSTAVFPPDWYPVLLNGAVVGFVDPDVILPLVKQLRHSKTLGLNGVPKMMEIALVDGKATRQYRSLILVSTMMRLMRPVANLAAEEAVEYIGPMEQMYLDIACEPDDLSPRTTHAELKPTNILSVVASITPFSDFNQSPRNMYQCQMAKQTIGTPCYSYHYRSDNKLFRLTTPQIPMVQNENQNKYAVNSYPHGTNAVVAVISHTGYDMEDAMIINKSAYERGFGAAFVYKLEYVDLCKKFDSTDFVFSNLLPSSLKHTLSLDSDGLPAVGTKFQTGSAMYAYKSITDNSIHVVRYKSKEEAFVEDVVVIRKGELGITKATIKMRINRRPVVGDKFASRHGQKGVLSQLWPHTDMPFSEGGLSPDIIINPHAFPSRMTIGMLIESMAGKSGAFHGQFQESTPFRFHEDQTAAEFFGEQLVKAGFNYWGNEPMYSGIHGTLMEAEIFLGVVYYQRLRHMVKDKYQVRGSAGPINANTRQPVKGRAKGGGIRLGEMERDSMLAHGASFMLYDRLLNCSDGHKGHICGGCGSMLSIVSHAFKEPTCVNCSTGAKVRVLDLPFVLRFLANELASMNIRLVFKLQDSVDMI